MAQPRLDDLLAAVINQGGSDLHLSPGSPPIIRVSGKMLPLATQEVLTAAQTEEMLKSIVPKDRWEVFESTDNVDFSHSYGTEGRFRVNGFRAQGVCVIAMRLIPATIRSLTELNLPPVLETFATRTQGFFLVVGPVGQGKSTTLAAMVERINETRAEHILTIEDPIEYLHTNKKSVIKQREVYRDTTSFAEAGAGGSGDEGSRPGHFDDERPPPPRA